MAQYKDLLPSKQGWLHELARAEIHPEAEKLLQLGKSFDPHQLVEESSIVFLNELRTCFEENAKIFNSYSETGQKFAEAKIYSVAQTPADFIIFRNQVKLLFSSSSHGVIQIAFAKHVRSTVAFGSGATADQGGQEFNQTQELMAQVGPFRDVFWTFQGERVTPEQVAKFYFAEFCRATRSPSSSQSNNQMLVEEIRTLLKDKGIEL